MRRRDRENGSLETGMKSPTNRKLTFLIKRKSTVIMKSQGLKGKPRERFLKFT